jgi:hypothetical protein
MATQKRKLELVLDDNAIFKKHKPSAEYEPINNDTLNKDQIISILIEKGYIEDGIANDIKRYYVNASAVILETFLNNKHKRGILADYTLIKKYDKFSICLNEIVQILNLNINVYSISHEMGMKAIQNLVTNFENNEKALIVFPFVYCEALSFKNVDLCYMLK